MQLADIDTPLQRGKLADYKRDSNPPTYGALANFAAATSLGIKLRTWQEALEEYFRAARNP